MSSGNSSSLCKRRHSVSTKTATENSSNSRPFAVAQHPERLEQGELVVEAPAETLEEAIVGVVEVLVIVGMPTDCL